MAESRNCQICETNRSKYSCPRCNILYCSVSCYQSETHFQCSEAFYQKCVQEELANRQCSPQEKRKILEILRRQEQESDSDKSLDSDDEETEPDLVKRMADVNLDDEDAVWEKLTREERHEFRKLLSSGNILKMLPEWEPWWKVRKRKTLIQDCKENFDWKTLCPKVSSQIPQLSQLTKANPSPKVPFMVLSVLISYVFTARWFKGTHLQMPVEAISTCIALSDVLRNNAVFEKPVEAFAAFENDLSKCAWVKEVDYDRNIMQEDLVDILRIPGADDLFYCIKAALSDLKSVCSKAIDILKDRKMGHLKRFSDPPPEISLVQKISKKIIYYLSWSDVHGSLLMFGQHCEVPRLVLGGRKNVLLRLEGLAKQDEIPPPSPANTWVKYCHWTRHPLSTLQVHTGAMQANKTFAKTPPP